MTIHSSTIELCLFSFLATIFESEITLHDVYIMFHFFATGVTLAVLHFDPSLGGTAMEESKTGICKSLIYMERQEMECQWPVGGVRRLYCDSKWTSEGL